MSKFFTERECCPACESTNFSVVYSNAYAKEPIKTYLQDFYLPQCKLDFELLNDVDYTLCECGACGLVFQKNIPNSFLSEKVYEEWIDSEKGQKMNMLNLANSKTSLQFQEIKMLTKFFKNSPKMKFLDFGFGWGTWCRIAKTFGIEVYGVEISKPQIKNAESFGVNVIDYDEIPDYRFLMINTEQVFEHIPEPLNTLRVLKEALENGGLIKISVPNGADIKRRLKIMDWKAKKGTRNSLNIVHPLEHLNCYSHMTIIKMAKKAGLRQVKIPLRIQYACYRNWNSPMQIIKTIVRPLHRNFMNGTYLFFQR